MSDGLVVDNHHRMNMKVSKKHHMKALNSISLVSLS